MAKRTVGFRFSQQTLDRLERVATAWAVTRTSAFEQMVDEAWAKLSYQPVERTSAHAGSGELENTVAAPERSSAQQPQKTAELAAKQDKIPVPLPRAGHAKPADEKYPVRDAYANLQAAMESKVKERPARKGGRKKGGS